MEHSQIKSMMAELVERGQRLGATAVEVAVSGDHGFTVSSRLGDVETVEQNRDKNCTITVYFSQRRGSVTSSDFSHESLNLLLHRACEIAKASDEDPYIGLAEPELMAQHPKDLALDWPWALTPDEAIELTTRCEQAALAHDKRLVNSDGCHLATYRFTRGYANSHGFNHVFNATRHSLNCVLMAQDDDGLKREYDFTTSRDAQQLLDVEQLARSAAEKTLARLNEQKISTRCCPVVFANDVSSTLLGALISAISGGSIYRKASFLLDKLGEMVLPARYSVFECPHIPKGLGSAYYDLEGVQTRANTFVASGKLKHYVLDSYTARRLDMTTTANAGGVHNLTLSNDNCTQAELLKTMGEGLLVTSLMGSAVNLVTGDYSRGASGFWVENGKIAFPVDEVTIAGSLPKMLLGIQQVANDVDPRRSTQCGSILIDEMTVAGS